MAAPADEDTGRRSLPVPIALPLMPEASDPASTSSPSWLRRRVVGPLLGLLRQGLSPEQLALTVAVGVGVGLVPFLGAITTLATLAALRLRLNVAAMQLVSHLMTPLQLLIFLPLLRQGARLLGNAQEKELTLNQVRQLFAHDWRAALHLLWRAEVGALALWLLGALPLMVVLYFVLRPLFRRMAARTAANRSAV